LAEAKRLADAEHTRADQATQSEQARLELLAVIGHELATPLTVARGNVTAIRKFLADNNQLSLDLSTRAIDAEVAIERLLALREDLVAASRNEIRELELGPLKVESAINRAVKWAESTANEKGLKVTTCFEATKSQVMADPDALQSILGNLLSNAIRYTPSGGSIRVTTRNDADKVLIDVKDTGIGLSEEARSRLFERFYRSEEAKQMASWGLGLGLAIASELAHALGATIAADSIRGKGSTFTVTFPAPNVKEN